MVRHDARHGAADKKTPPIDSTCFSGGFRRGGNSFRGFSRGGWGGRKKAIPGGQRGRFRLENHLQGRRPDIPKFIDAVLGSAVQVSASDIHFQPLDQSSRVSFRTGGELEEVAIVLRSHHDAVVRRLKVLARLVTHRSDSPQDGRFSMETSRGVVDIRVSVLPTHHGEKVVLRLARFDSGLFELSRLGMPDLVQQKFQELLRQPQGVVILTGPTGSGKTTTLYASLGFIHEDRGQTVNLASIEEPIEVDLPFVSQTQVHRSSGLNFGESLRSVLRQDPNVLMVGEIRDAESASTVIQAGLSGHLILTTLHAESAVGALPRLIDLGVEPFLASSAIIATASQRLLRRLCPDCRHPAAVSRRLQKRLAGLEVETEGMTFQTAGGCDSCTGTGVQGRKAIFELLPLSTNLRRLFTARANTDALLDAALEEGMVPLLETALAAAAQGEVSLEEAMGVVS